MTISGNFRTMPLHDVDALLVLQSLIEAGHLEIEFP
jgi:hypothetical protein